MRNQAQLAEILTNHSYDLLAHKSMGVFVKPNYEDKYEYICALSKLSCYIARVLGADDEICEVIAAAFELGCAPYGLIGETYLKTKHGYSKETQSHRFISNLEIPNEIKNEILNFQAPTTFEGKIVSYLDSLMRHMPKLDESFAEEFKKDIIENSKGGTLRLSASMQSKVDEITAKEREGNIRDTIAIQKIENAIEKKIAELDAGKSSQEICDYICGLTDSQLQ